MAKAPTGDAIIVEVGALADPEVRAVPVTLESIVGTSTGFQIGEQELEVREFGNANSLWEDGAVITKNWQIPIQTNFRPDEAANAILESKALTTEEIYVALYPFGKVTGQPMYTGYATVNGFQASMPRDGVMTASATLKGRGVLTKGTAA